MKFRIFTITVMLIGLGIWSDQSLAEANSNPFAAPVKSEKPKKSDDKPLSASAQIVPFEIETGQIAQLEIELKLPSKYRAYEDQFRLRVVSPEGINVSKPHIEPIKDIYDKFSKKNKNVILGSAKMRTAVEFQNLVSDGEQKFVLEIMYQACTDSYCLFPQALNLDVHFKAKPTGKAGNLPMSFAGAYEKGLFWAFLFVFVFGFLTSFTPCVYPMIPITLAILGKEAHARTRLQNFLVSLTYVGGIAVTFSALGVFAASTGALFGAFMASPWVLGFICLVFITMSLSMFGVFELQAPQFLRDGALSHMKLHGYIGAFISGLLAGVVASPCVGPVLVGVLTFVAQTKNLWLGFWLLFVYALGMGLIFLALGMSTNMTKMLPRSGSWMNRVKIFFGLLLIAAAVYYLDILLVSSKVIQTSFITRALSPSTDEKKPGFQVDTIKWQTYSADLLAQAAKNGKPVLIDFRADWCAACIEMEEKTFPSQGLQLLSAQFVMVRYDATQESEELAALREKYEIVGLPTILFFGRDGKWLKDLTLTAFEDAAGFEQRMSKALK
jgi:thioredoxin:protein disulfide reductase